MNNFDSWRQKLHELKRLPRPNLSPRVSGMSQNLAPLTPRAAHSDLGSAARRRPSLLRALDKRNLEFSYSSVEDVGRFKDNPTPDLPHRPHPSSAPSTAKLGDKTTRSKGSKRESVASMRGATLNIPDEYVVNREKIKFRLFHRRPAPQEHFRYIPECLDTTSEFYNPRVSADERFNKYLQEMKRVK